MGGGSHFPDDELLPLQSLSIGNGTKMVQKASQALDHGDSDIHPKSSQGTSTDEVLQSNDSNPNRAHLITLDGVTSSSVNQAGCITAQPRNAPFPNQTNNPPAQLPFPPRSQPVPIPTSQRNNHLTTEFNRMTFCEKCQKGQVMNSPDDQLSPCQIKGCGNYGIRPFQGRLKSSNAARRAMRFCEECREGQVMDRPEERYSPCRTEWCFNYGVRPLKEIFPSSSSRTPNRAQFFGATNQNPGNQPSPYNTSQVETSTNPTETPSDGYVSHHSERYGPAYSSQINTPLGLNKHTNIYSTSDSPSLPRANSAYFAATGIHYDMSDYNDFLHSSRNLTLHRHFHTFGIPRSLTPYPDISANTKPLTGLSKSQNQVTTAPRKQLSQQDTKADMEKANEVFETSAQQTKKAIERDSKLTESDIQLDAGAEDVWEG